MKFITPKFLIIVLPLAALLSVKAQSSNPKTLDVKLFANVDLKRFGGYDMDLTIKDIDPVKACFVTVDRTKMVIRTSAGSVAVAGYGYYGGYAAAAASSSTQTMPTISPYEILLTNGLPVEGTAMQKLFLLYEDDKIAVYYHNTIATPAGVYRLRVITKS